MAELKLTSVCGKCAVAVARVAAGVSFDFVGVEAGNALCNPSRPLGTIASPAAAAAFVSFLARGNRQTDTGWEIEDAVPYRLTSWIERSGVPTAVLLLKRMLPQATIRYKVELDAASLQALITFLEARPGRGLSTSPVFGL